MNSCTQTIGWITAKEKSIATAKRLKQFRIDEYDNTPSRCTSCGIALPYEKRKHKFCGHRCAATHNNIGVNRHNGSALVNKACTSCGESISTRIMNHRPMCDNCKVKPHTHSLKLALKLNHRNSTKSCIQCDIELTNPDSIYCSRECSAKHRRQLFFNNYLNKQNDTKYVSSSLRKTLIEHANNKCTLCGWGERNQYSCTIPLVIDHIDGHPENNRLDNLRVICPNCDSLTPTYKGLNKGNGRKSRALLYHKGKMSIAENKVSTLVI